MNMIVEGVTLQYYFLYLLFYIFIYYFIFLFIILYFYFLGGDAYPITAHAILFPA